MRSANEDLSARIETLQTNTKLLEAQLLETQRAKAKVDKEFESEKLLKEQKMQVNWTCRIGCVKSNGCFLNKRAFKPFLQDHTSAVKDVEELQAQLQKEKKHLQKIMEELELAKKVDHIASQMIAIMTNCKE